MRRVVLDDSSCLIIDPWCNGQDGLVQSGEQKAGAASRSVPGVNKADRSRTVQLHPAAVKTAGCFGNDLSQSSCCASISFRQNLSFFCSK